MTASERLLALREAATPGPLEDAGPFTTRSELNLRLIVTNYPPVIAGCGVGFTYSEADAALIVTLVNALPELMGFVAAAEEYVCGEPDCPRCEPTYRALAALEAKLSP